MKTILYQNKIKELLKTTSDAYLKFLNSCEKLNESQLKEYFDLFDDVLKEDFETVFKRYNIEIGFINDDDDRYNSVLDFIPKYSDKYGDLDNIIEEDPYQISIQATNNFIQRKKSELEEIKTVLTSKRKIPIENILKSYYWRGSNENLKKLFNFLKLHKYLAQKEDFTLFKKAFSNQRLIEKPRIKWFRSHQELAPDLSPFKLVRL